MAFTYVHNDGTGKRVLTTVICVCIFWVICVFIFWVICVCFLVLCGTYYVLRKSLGNLRLFFGVICVLFFGFVWHLLRFLANHSVLCVFIFLHYLRLLLRFLANHSVICVFIFALSSYSYPKHREHYVGRGTRRKGRENPKGSPTLNEEAALSSKASFHLEPKHNSSAKLHNQTTTLHTEGP